MAACATGIERGYLSGSSLSIWKEGEAEDYEVAFTAIIHYERGIAAAMESEAEGITGITI